MADTLDKGQITRVYSDLNRLKFKSKFQKYFDNMLEENPEAILKYIHSMNSPSRVSLKAEATIIKAGPKQIKEYMKATGMKVWPEAEDVLSKAPHAAVWYATLSPGKRFEKAEPVISTNPTASAVYATEVLGQRFELGEPAIKQLDALWDDYKKEFGIK